MSPSRPILLYARWLIRKGYSGFAFWPVVFLRDRSCCTDRILQHERIHLRQQAEMLVLPFYIWYFSEYLIRRLQHGSWQEAYMAISFEREAYAHECDEGYLERRKLWSWWGWL